MRTGIDHVLVLDSSTTSPFVCLVREGRLLCTKESPAERSFSQQGIGLILEALEEAGLEPADLAAVACVVGPGSFTGARIGLAMVKGLFFRTNVPAIALSSLRLFAQPCLGKAATVCPVIDARMGDIYAAAYDDRGNEVLAPRAEPPNDFAARLSGPVIFCGPNPAVFAPVLQAHARITCAFEASSQQAYQQSAVTAAWKDFEKRVFVSVPELEPAYLRKSYAEIKAGSES